MGFYVESADRPNQSRLAAEDVHVGTLVNENGSDLYRRTEGTDTPEALATAPRRGDYIAKEEDETTNFRYLASENDRIPAQPLADRDVVKVRTADDNSTDPAASIEDGDVVGVAAVGGQEFEGRIVEEGYTDNAGTVYGRSSGGDFAALGVAYKDSGTSFDVPVRVEVRRDL